MKINLSKNMKKTNKGITLMALVITIIILIILAIVIIVIKTKENNKLEKEYTIPKVYFVNFLADKNADG